MEQLFDISTVCKMLGVTSRTLRFYEQKSIIQSTKDDFGVRRQYNKQQINRIKQVLVLRSLGLSVAKIQELQKGNDNLSLVVTEKKAEILASIVTKTKELDLLNNTLSIIENGGDIFKDNVITENPKLEDNERLKIVDVCTDFIISGHIKKCYIYFSKTLCDYMPLTVFEGVRTDTLKPLGGFINKYKIEHDYKFHNVIYQYLKYENLGLYIKYVFQGDTISGIWLNYYEPKEKTYDYK